MSVQIPPAGVQYMFAFESKVKVKVKVKISVIIWNFILPYFSQPALVKSSLKIVDKSSTTER